MASRELIKKIHNHIDEKFPDHLERVRVFLRQKGISAIGEGIRETAQIVRELTAEIGGVTQYPGEPEEVIEKFKKHLIQKGYDDIEVMVRDNYTWSKTDFNEEIVQKFMAAYGKFGRNPEIWPMAPRAAP